MMKSGIAFAALATACLAAHAADPGVYVYGAYGQAKSERKDQADAATRGAGASAFTSRGDESDSAHKLQLGYHFNPYAAIEGGYVNLGKYTYDATITAPLSATRTGDVSIDGWNLGLKLGVPVGEHFSVVATVGVFSYSLDFKCKGTGVPCVNPSRTESGTPLYYGVGVEWTPGGRWLVRAEYEVFTDVGERFNGNGTTGTTQADVKLGSVGVGYRF